MAALRVSGRGVHMLMNFMASPFGVGWCCWGPEFFWIVLGAWVFADRGCSLRTELYLKAGGEANSRFPEGMTERKARATARPKAKAAPLIELYAGVGVGGAGGPYGWGWWVVGARWFDGAGSVRAGGVGDGAAAEAGEDLGLEVVGGSRIVGEEESVGAAARADIPQRVEVLREEDEGHNFAGGGAGDALLEVFDGGGEAVDDGLALAGDAVALEGLGFGFGLGLLDLEDFLGFAASLCGDLRALGGVDVVHGGFDFVVGDDVGDEGVEDVEAEAGHGGV